MFFTLVETGSALKPWRLWKNEKMTLWVVEATTESSEKMKSKRAVRWHDLDKGNMDRSKNRFCSASILKRRVVKQMSIFLVQPGNTWQWRQKPWTTKKKEARKKPRNCTRLHEIRKLGANLFLTIIYLQISRIFRTCWVTHLKFIEWVEKIERTKRTKLVPTILEQNWWKSCWNHSTETILSVQNPAWKSKEWPPSDHFLAILFEANVT